jgi:hypothetical protein
MVVGRNIEVEVIGETRRRRETAFRVGRQIGSL